VGLMKFYHSISVLIMSLFCSCLLSASNGEHREFEISDERPAGQRRALTTGIDPKRHDLVPNLLSEKIPELGGKTLEEVFREFSIDPKFASKNMSALPANGDFKDVALASPEERTTKAVEIGSLLEICLRYMQQFVQKAANNNQRLAQDLLGTNEIEIDGKIVKINGFLNAFLERGQKPDTLPHYVGNPQFVKPIEDDSGNEALDQQEYTIESIVYKKAIVMHDNRNGGKYIPPTEEQKLKGGYHTDPQIMSILQKTFRQVYSNLFHMQNTLEDAPYNPYGKYDSSVFKIYDLLHIAFDKVAQFYWSGEQALALYALKLEMNNREEQTRLLQYMTFWNGSDEKIGYSNILRHKLCVLYREMVSLTLLHNAQSGFDIWSMIKVTPMLDQTKAIIGSIYLSRDGVETKQAVCTLPGFAHVYKHKRQQYVEACVSEDGTTYRGLFEYDFDAQHIKGVLAAISQYLDNDVNPDLIRILQDFNAYGNKYGGNHYPKEMLVIEEQNLNGNKGFILQSVRGITDWKNQYALELSKRMQVENQKTLSVINDFKTSVNYCEDLFNIFQLCLDTLTPTIDEAASPIPGNESEFYGNFFGSAANTFDKLWYTIRLMSEVVERGIKVWDIDNRPLSRERIVILDPGKIKFVTG